MICIKCMFRSMSGSNGTSYMSQLQLENGMQAKFVLIPVSDNGTSKLSYSNGVTDGKMKVTAHVCPNCGYLEFQRSY